MIKILTKSTFYKTYAEASLAAQRLEIKTQREYQKRYKEDSRLPCHPGRTYKHKGWKGLSFFLGSEELSYKFVPMKEAMLIVQQMGIMSYREYCKRYKEFPGLPSSPCEVYGEKWKGFAHFFGKPEVAHRFDKYTDEYHEDMSWIPDNEEEVVINRHLKTMLI